MKLMTPAAGESSESFPYADFLMGGTDEFDTASEIPNGNTDSLLEASDRVNLRLNFATNPKPSKSQLH